MGTVSGEGSSTPLTPLECCLVAATVANMKKAATGKDMK